MIELVDRSERRHREDPSQLHEKHPEEQADRHP
jgi:hypothetical protein